MRKLIEAHCPLWIILALPGCYWTYGYWQGTTFYGEYVHATGGLGAQLLIATMAVTPLRLAFPRTAFAHWLLPRRRHLGVAAFGYALLHGGAYVLRQPTARIVEEAQGAAMWTGWLALVLMLALAATSNDASERLMKRAWKSLHRIVYVTAALTLAHWVLSAFDPTSGYIHLAVLAALEAFRVWRTSRIRQAKRRARTESAA